METETFDAVDRVFVHEDDIWIVREYHDIPLGSDVILYCELHGDYSFDARKFGRTLYRRIMKAKLV